ncbi:MAG: J domain-containing protein [Polyangiaceae bacterium]
MNHRAMAASVRDPYEVLGVRRDASADEIRSAFRKLAAQHHPDRNPDDEGAQQRFKEINAAYQLLSDPQKREMFDRFGSTGGAGGGMPGNPFGGGMPIDLNDFAQSIPADGIFGDLLERLGFKFGDKGDLEKDIVITLEEAATGTEKEVVYDRIEVCSDCAGSGGKQGARGATCPVCAGRGRVRFQQGVLPLVVERECSKCSGRGRIISDPCTRCRGAGLTSKSHTLSVTLPPGIEHGATKLVERAGNVPRPDRGPGDLELTIKIAPHPIFKRNGDDIQCAVSVSFPRACLGGDVEIPTLDGKGKLKIPAGTQAGTVLRVRGRGMPKRGAPGRGDELIEVRVETPSSLSSRARELLTELDHELGEPTTAPTNSDAAPPSKSFVDKLKNFFG